MAGNWLALGRVILMSPGLCACRKSISCLVRRLVWRDLRLDDAGDARVDAPERRRPAQVRATPSLFVHAVDGLVEVGHEGAAAELTVGEDLEAEVLLLLEDVEDVLVLDGAQLRRGVTPGGAGVEELLRAAGSCLRGRRGTETPFCVLLARRGPRIGASRR